MGFAETMSKLPQNRQRLYGERKNARFVSGHRFSDATNVAEALPGFSR